MDRSLEHYRLQLREAASLTTSPRKRLKTQDTRSPRGSHRPSQTTDSVSVIDLETPPGSVRPSSSCSVEEVTEVTEITEITEDMESALTAGPAPTAPPAPLLPRMFADSGLERLAGHPLRDCPAMVGEPTDYLQVSFNWSDVTIVFVSFIVGLYNCNNC